MPQVRQPFELAPEWSVLMELSSGAEVDLSEALGVAMEKGWITDAVIAQSEHQAEGLWNVRESIPEANRLNRCHFQSRHPQFQFCVSLSSSKKLPALLARLGDLRINCFGHLGDGNLHYNVFPPLGGSKEALKHLSQDVQKIVHDQVHAFDGSISAEHGIGRLKSADLISYGDAGKLSAMRAIKAALDPRWHYEIQVQ